jgi:hypothetical protein
MSKQGCHPRFWHFAVIASLAVKQLEVTGRATSNLRNVRLGRPPAQDDALGGRLGQANPLGKPSAS